MRLVKIIAIRNGDDRDATSKPSVACGEPAAVGPNPDVVAAPTALL